MDESNESYLGIILWADQDGHRGVLGDIKGQTWHFTESMPERGTFNQIPVYKDGWRPKVSIRQHRISGKQFVETEPEIVEFTINFFTHRDGSEGYRISSIRSASDYGQEEYELLATVRENRDTQKFMERQAKREMKQR